MQGSFQGFSVSGRLKHARHALCNFVVIVVGKSRRFVEYIYRESSN